MYFSGGLQNGQQLTLPFTPLRRSRQGGQIEYYDRVTYRARNNDKHGMSEQLQQQLQKAVFFKYALPLLL